MNELVEAIRNPFSAARFAPDRMEFLFAPGQSAAGLLERLRAADWRGEIVGPHGSGKSTLLATLLAAARLAGQPCLAVTLRYGQRRLPCDFLGAARCMAAQKDRVPAVPLLAVDGYEQLGRWHRFLLGRLCRRRLGLVVTSHHPVGLPALCHTAVDPALAWRVVERLQAGSPPLVDGADVAERLAAHGGNLRETLFDLYDLFARRLAM